jgi:hypothetical protein
MAIGRQAADRGRPRKMATMAKVAKVAKRVGMAGGR